MRCPMLNALYREGWREKYIGIPTLATMVGKAVALGLGVYNNYRKQLEDKGRQIDSLSDSERADVSKYAMDVALRHCADEMEEIEKSELVFSSNSESYLRSVQDRICFTVVGYTMADPIKPEHRIISAEHDLGPEYGNARIDLVYLIQQPHERRILDYKSMSTYRAQYFERDMEKYRDHFNMLHYLWAWNDKYGDSIEAYDICALVTQPYRVELRTYPVHPETLALWHQSTAAHWSVMEKIEQGEILPWMVSEHEDKWGKCGMYEACFKYRFDPQAMKNRYVKIVHPGN